jgi:hypothetical protein
MRTIKFSFVTLDMIFEDRSMEVRTFTPMELAAFKRSKRYKKLLSKKVLLQWEVKLKTL